MAVPQRGGGAPSFFSPSVANKLRAMATDSLRAGIRELSRPQSHPCSWDAVQADRYFVSLLRDELKRREAALTTHH